MNARDFDAEAAPGDADLAAANRLDDQISAMLTGVPSTGTDPQLLWLANALRPDPSAATHARIDARIEAGTRSARARRWRWARLAAAVLGFFFLVHGIGNMVAGEWISSNLGEPFNEHAMVDGGLAFLAVGSAVLVAATRVRWLPVGIIVGVPFGLILGGRGLHEVGTFAWGATLHGATGLAAIMALVTFAIGWRYGRKGGAEDRV
ncbi:hypothetical protein QSJ18_06935 [Gordonia sp. ABSL1-1]|uniref:hypothetical protein n=1 Tax=Gordonia sp. ABSL1-1 TaxID=3053923 RepID=UPI0025735E53|nr:hypothetical protein [Gordonia sp. ABSL1-1]MDL9936472.1 hypothetical protein [Gordonia sp. ABSL1-1]